MTAEPIEGGKFHAPLGDGSSEEFESPFLRTSLDRFVWQPAGAYPAELRYKP